MNYFIAVRKDKENPYSKENLIETKSEFWHKSYNGKLRKYVKVYDNIQSSDKILCYSALDKKICAILEVGEKNNKKIVLNFKNALDVSLEAIKAHYEVILSLSSKKYSPFTKNMKNIFYGTFFQTTKEQFDFICNLENVNVYEYIEQEFNAHETGQEAENIFQNNYQTIQTQYKPFADKKLNDDMRLKGAGYDFELVDRNGDKYFVEVKGCKSCNANSIRLTQKEYQQATKEQNRYFLVIVEIDNKQILIIQNPLSKTKPKGIYVYGIAYQIPISKNICDKIVDTKIT